MTTKIIGLCRTDGVYTHGHTRTATVTEAYLGLQLKLFEEVGEVCRAPRDVAEYADVLQVLFDLARYHGISEDEIEQARRAKADAKGGMIPARLWAAKDSGLI